MTSPQHIAGPSGTTGSVPVSIEAVRAVNAPPPDRQATIADLQAKQLAEMREIGMGLLRDLDEDCDLPVEKRPSVNQRAQAFERITKALRQIMALEQETLGLREKRLEKVRADWGKARKDTVRRSVEHSVTVAKPDLDKVKRERLLGDLFTDYRQFTTGSIRT